MDGTQLRNLRIFNQLTQEQFSKLLGISAPHLSKIENNHLPISRNLSVRLAQQFDMTAEYLEAVRKYYSFFNHFK